MRQYRVYQTNRGGLDAWLIEVITCETDERAIELATKIGLDIEVWEGRRLVASIKG
jgi:hypothetical protein